MNTVAILEPVPDFFRAALIQKGFGLWDTTPASIKENKRVYNTVVGLVIRSKTYVDAILMDSFPSLHFIMRPGSGLDNVDQAAAASRGITLFTSPEGNCHSVGEHTTGMLLALLHRIPQASAEVKAGKWEREVNRGMELRELTVGIVGCGHTGKAFARNLEGFSCERWIYDPYVPSATIARYGKAVEQEELLMQADVISFHVPYTKETHHYLTENILYSRMKPAIVLNTSRGSVVSSRVLLNGLKNGKLKAAGLDVLETEDHEVPPSDVVEATNALKNREDVIVTPHIAGWSYTSEKAIYNGLLAKLEAFYAHE